MSKVWTVLVIGMVAVVFWFGIHACYEVYVYQQLQERAPINHIDWSVMKLGRERYGFQASYAFLKNGAVQRGDTVFVKGPVFRNRWAAEQALSDYAELHQRVWYSPGALEYSSLQKRFPLKECVSGGILCAILTYFAGLGYYSKRVYK